jgi:hypothetical protein
VDTKKQASTTSGSLKLNAEKNEAEEKSCQSIGNGWGAAVGTDATVNLSFLENVAHAESKQKIGEYSQDPSSTKQ